MRTLKLIAAASMLAAFPMPAPSMAQDPSPPAKSQGGDHGSGTNPKTGPAYRGPQAPNAAPRPAILPSLKNILSAKGEIFLDESAAGVLPKFYSFYKDLPRRLRIEDRDRGELQRLILDGTGNWSEMFGEKDPKDSAAVRLLWPYVKIDGARSFEVSDLDKIGRAMRLKLEIRVNPRLRNCELCAEEQFLPIPAAGIQFQVSCTVHGKGGEVNDENLTRYLHPDFDLKPPTVTLSEPIVITSKRDYVAKTLDLSEVAGAISLRYCEGSKSPPRFVVRVTCSVRPATLQDESLFAAAFDPSESGGPRYYVGHMDHSFIDEKQAENWGEATDIGYLIRGANRDHHYGHGMKDSGKLVRYTEYQTQATLRGEPIEGKLTVRYRAQEELDRIIETAARNALSWQGKVSKE
jgi:hypothetical protein